MTAAIHYLRRHQRTLGSDLLASVVVFLVALPLCMGVAIASGVPPAAGLITGMVGGLVVGTLAGCPLGVSGPAAGLAVVVLELVQQHGLGTLGVIVLLAGAMQFLAGLLRLGRWFQAVSPAVIHGMLAGIGVLIFASQFHVMVDDKPPGTGIQNLVTIPSAIYKGLFPLDGSSHHLAAMVGLLTLLILIAWNTWKPRRLTLLPGPLLAVITGALVAALWEMPIRYVTVPANLLEAVSLPGPVELGRIFEPSILLAAAALAFIASAETLLCATAVDQLHGGTRTDYDRELWAQGVGNFLCGLLGALPMTGVIVRSSANVQAGATTRVSAIAHGVWLLAFVVALPFILNRIPLAALAAILVYTGYKLVNVQALKHLARFGRFEVFVYLATITTIVTADLLSGVLVGLGLALCRLLYILAYLEVELVESGPGRMALFLRGAATFVTLPRLTEVLDRVPRGSALVVHTRELSFIDPACLDALGAWETRHKTSGGSLEVEWDELLERFHSRKRVNMAS